MGTTPLPATVWTLRRALENALMAHTRTNLEGVLLDILKLPLPDGEPLDPEWSKRGVIQAFTHPLELPALVHLARRIVTEVEPDDELATLVAAYQAGGGVVGVVKNLIFAADGPKPELVLTDALNNTIEITRHAEHCLVYDRPVPTGGLLFSDLVSWWRDERGLGDADDIAVGRDLHERLRASLQGNPMEEVVLKAYASRYRRAGFGIPALVPQVYLHYDPYTSLRRGTSGSPLARQRMDFLMLFSDRRRVVLEVDGRQHYSTDDGRADTTRYAEMVAEDRRLRLAGYEVYRFGGKELAHPRAQEMLSDFFDDLAGSTAR